MLDPILVQNVCFKSLLSGSAVLHKTSFLVATLTTEDENLQYGFPFFFLENSLLTYSRLYVFTFIPCKKEEVSITALLTKTEKHSNWVSLNSVMCNSPYG